METKKRGSKRSRKGLVLPLAIAIALCLAILGIGLLQLGFGSRVIAALTTESISARVAADAGIADALFKMNAAFIPGQDPPSPPAPDVVVPQPLDNTNATYTYTITEGQYQNPLPYQDPRYWLITSTGKLNRQEKKVYATASITNEFEYALIVNDTIVFKSSTTIDGYNSTFGYPSPPGTYELKIGTNNSVPPPPTYPIKLNQNTVIEGDVLVGVGGNPDELIWDPEPLEKTGNRYSLPSPVEFKQKIPPAIYDDTVDLVGSDLKIIAPVGATKLNPYIVVAPTANISNLMTVVGHVVLHVKGDMRFGSSAYLYVGEPPPEVPEDPPVPPVPSSLIIYLDGDLDGGNAGGINNLSKIPDDFRLYGTASGGQIQKWVIKNSLNFYGVYYAPNADIIMHNEGDIFGSIAGYRFETKNSGMMHYDVRLSDLSGTETGFGIDRWWEETLPLSP